MNDKTVPSLRTNFSRRSCTNASSRFIHPCPAALPVPQRGLFPDKDARGSGFFMTRVPSPAVLIWHPACRSPKYRAATPRSSASFSKPEITAVRCPAAVDSTCLPHLNPTHPGCPPQAEFPPWNDANRSGHQGTRNNCAKPGKVKTRSTGRRSGAFSSLPVIAVSLSMARLRHPAR